MLPARLHQNASVQALKCRLFALTGHKPSHRWYGTYRLREIKRVLSAPFDPDQLPAQHGRWLDERMVEYPWMFSRLPEGPGSLLDAGSILNFGFALLCGAAFLSAYAVRALRWRWFLAPDKVTELARVGRSAEPPPPKDQPTG